MNSTDFRLSVASILGLVLGNFEKNGKRINASFRDLEKD
jgi:hypothetical protein